MVNSYQAEQAVIGSILIEPSVLVGVRDIVSASDLEYPDYSRAYKAAVEMYAAGEKIDLLTVSLKTGIEKSVLAECVDQCGTSAHAEYYAKLAVTKSLERKIIRACQELGVTQDQGQLDKISELVLRKESLGAPKLFDYTKDIMSALDEIFQSKKYKTLKTGINGLDNLWVSMRPGEINTWAAATNVGKSLMLLNLMNEAAKAGTRCLYVGTEMSAIETFQRHLSITSAVEPWKIRAQTLDLEEKARIVNSAAARMADMSIRILDLPEPELKDIEAAIVASKAEVVFLDYLERFTLPPEDALRLRIKEFMRRLKSMSRRREVVIHLASQLNRQAYGHEEKRPTMAEISEASAVEKESDRVVLMWTPKDKQHRTDGKVLELIVSKNRHGKRGLMLDVFVSDRNLQITEVVDHAGVNAD